MPEEDKAIYAIIHKEIEPGVINDEMIQRLYREQGYKGEAGRLALLDPIVYENITVLRFEFLNIIRIDHLWVLPNLKILSLNFNKIEIIENLEMLTKLTELDLSFNYINKIENLDSLVNLEILTLFNNKIKELENIDALQNLLIFSIGNNLIETYKGIERLRFLKKLTSFNMEGNPISANKSEFRMYIAACLPSIKYYNYSFIKPNEREEGIAHFASELKIIHDEEKQEIEERERIAKAEYDEMRLSSSFVELLNEHQLFESMFEGDEEGDALLLVRDEVEEADEYIKEYQDEAYELTQQIYKLGLEKHEQRQKEIKMFRECVDEAQIKTQQKGQIIVNEFLEHCDQVFESARKYWKIIETEIAQAVGEPTSEDYATAMAEMESLAEDFNGMIDDTWQVLMESELTLFESVEEANSQFGHTITDLLNEFIEQAQNYFVQLRDAECNYSDSLGDLVNRYISNKVAEGDSAFVPEALKDCLEDKDALINLIAGSRDYHMQKIDSREDKLIKRARAWASDLISAMQVDEIERNRKKVMEINYFLNKQKDLFDEIRFTMRDEILRQENH